MKLNEKALGMSLSIIGAIYYILCASLIYIAPDLYKGIASSWTHGVDITQIWVSSPPDIGKVIWGLITFTIASWVTGYGVAWVYNKVVKST